MLHSTVMWCSQTGVEYRILVHGFSSATGNFDLAVSDDGVPCGVPPVNDECADAQAVGCNSSTTFDNSNATTDPADPPFSCRAGGAAQGVGTMWFSFVATHTSAFLETNNSAVSDTLLAVYDGTCGNLVEIACSEDEGDGFLSEVCAKNLIVGNTYIVQVASFSAFSQGSITLDITCPCPAPPPNDLCEDAIGPLAVPSVESGTTNGASFDDVGFCGTSNTAPGVWYTVIGTGNTLTVTTCENQSFPGSADYDTRISVFTGDCPGPVSNCCTNHGGLGCDDPDCQDAVCAVDPFCCATAWDSICVGEAEDLCGDLCVSSLTCVAGNDDEPGCSFHSTVMWDSQVGVEYRILVHGFGSATGNFDLAISEPVPPANDLCEDAIGPLAVPSVESGTTQDATFDDVGFCGTSNTAPGVWYTVIGTGTTMTATTCENQSFPGSADYDTKISVFCGDCPTVPDSNCCTDHGGPGCDDSDCQDAVCAVDPFCCATAWDSICAGEAADLCGDLCATGAICVAGNDDEPGCSFHSTVTWCSQLGAEYRILVHGFSSATGNFELAVSDDGEPCTATVKCLPEGACCFSDGSCIASTEIDCSVQGGEYQGDDTECFNLVGNPAVTVTNPNLAIPDNDPVGVSDTIEILDDVIIGDVDVDVVIDHTFIRDLRISIEHNGQVVTLWDRECGFQDNLDVIFDDEGGPAVCASPTLGNIDPLTADGDPLSTFDGQSSAGTWTITVSDNAGFDLGTLIQWSLHIDEGVPICTQPGSLEIKPESCPNPLNITNRGVLPVALVGIPELNAADVDLSTVEISRADGVGGSVAPLGGRPGPSRNLEDVATPFDGELCGCHELNGDGVLDLSMKFDVQELVSVLELDSVAKHTFVELCVTWRLNNGTPFVACDCVRIQGRGAAR